MVENENDESTAANGQPYAKGASGKDLVQPRAAGRLRERRAGGEADGQDEDKNRSQPPHCNPPFSVNR